MAVAPVRRRLGWWRRQRSGDLTVTVNLATTSGRFLSPSAPPILLNPITNAVQGMNEHGYADG